MSVIKLTQDQWASILVNLKQQYIDKPSVFLIRDTMRRELGFTVRNHRYWKPAEGTASYDGYGDYIQEVHLDFYSEEAATMFRLRYL